MSNPFEYVASFMAASDQTIYTPNPSQAALYEELIFEEFREWREAKTEKFSATADLHELCDLIWVLIGYGQSMGYRLPEAFEELARANLSKVNPETGRVHKRSDGKVLKPEGYKPPDMSPFVV